MKLPSLCRGIVVCVTIVLANAAIADGVSIKKRQALNGNEMVTIQIGLFGGTHRVTRSVYQSMVKQGVPAKLIEPAKPRTRTGKRSLRNPSETWNTGVFR